MALVYRQATLADVPAIVDLCNNHGGYDEIDAQVVKTGGTWYVADIGEVIGCVWFITDRQHASIDYLAIRGDYQNAGNYRLVLSKLKTFLNNQGINFFHGLIQLPNEEWLKIEGESYAPLPATAVAFYEQHALSE